MTRFLHIADIHHARHSSNAITAERPSFDIQRDKLNQLVDVIRSESIQAILVAGDVEVSDPHDFMPYLKAWTTLGASVYIIFGEHDVDRIAYTRLWEEVPNVHCFLEPGYLIDTHAGIGVYGLSCDSNQTGLAEKLLQIPNLNDSYPHILLSHGKISHFNNERLSSNDFDYVALGDHHRYKHVRRGNSSIVYPGHVFSVWDGNGKSWPTGYVIASVTDDGITHEFRTFAGPQTRRVCVNPFILNEGKIQLILDNIDSDGDHWIEDDEQIIRTLIRSILETYPSDYFVTPSHSAYPIRRHCMTGQTLLECPNHFDDFIRRSYKTTPRTQ